MPSSKGKPTDPKLREEAKKEVQQSGEGGAPGQWTANKAARMAKVYEEKGGDYENESGSKNKAKKGAPEPKDPGEKQDKPGQGKRKNQKGGAAKKRKAEEVEEEDDDEPEADDAEEEEPEESEEEKPKRKSARGGAKKQKAAASQKKKAKK